MPERNEQVTENPTDKEPEKAEKQPKQKRERKARPPYTGDIPEVCSVPIAAEILDVGRNSIYDGINNGQIPYVQVLSRKLVKLREFLKG